MKERAKRERERMMRKSEIKDGQIKREREIENRQM
jgi:hypothetical protein